MLEAVDEIADAVGQAAESLGVKGGQSKNFQAQALAQARIDIHDNPPAAVGIAVSAGCLPSRLLRSRPNLSHSSRRAKV